MNYCLSQVTWAILRVYDLAMAKRRRHHMMHEESYIICIYEVLRLYWDEFTIWFRKLSSEPQQIAC